MRELVIDLDAIAGNLHTMRAGSVGAKVMGVVKANAYGHGMVAVAKRLEAEGVDYLGVADIGEALELRAAGIKAPVLAWLHDPHETFVDAVRHDIELGVATLAHLESVAAAARKLGKVAAVHLKVDTGLGRNGATLHEWPSLVAEARDLAEAGLLRVVGVFSHLSVTSAADDLAQIEKFDDAVEQARNLGLEFELRHLLASDGAILYPQACYEMVRIGIALYGFSPFIDHAAAEYGLRTAMTAKSVVAQTKRVPAGHGVSYGYLHRTASESTLALIPVGYAEGLPRDATGAAQVSIRGRRYTILARIAMDQFVIDCGDDEVEVGDEVIIFGDPSHDLPSADSWARAVGTINYEIVTRMGGRFKRRYLGEVQ
jgi:alanine racemase